MILTEEQKEELTQRISELDDNYICFGAVFVEVEKIIEVIEKFMEENNIQTKLSRKTGK